MKINPINSKVCIFIITFIICFISPQHINAGNKLKKHKPFKIEDCDDPNKNINSIECFLAKLSMSIHTQWDENVEKDKIDLKKLGKGLKAEIAIEILKNGKIKNFKLRKKRSGNLLFDQLVVKTVVQCIPFSKLPEGMEFYKTTLSFGPF